MERITDRDLDELRATAIRMGSHAEAILAKALKAVWTLDPDLAAEVPEDDLEIDRLDLAVDDAILRLLALRAPVALDLRTVLATKSLATDLERVGDLARNIAQNAAALVASKTAASAAPPALRELADESQRLLRRALGAFADRDADVARSVIADDDRVDRGETRVLADALRRIPQEPEGAPREVAFMYIATSLERVGDHATNIAEDVILAVEAVNLKHAGKLE